MHYSTHNLWLCIETRTFLLHSFYSVGYPNSSYFDIGYSLVYLQRPESCASEAYSSKHYTTPLFKSGQDHLLFLLYTVFPYVWLNSKHDICFHGASFLSPQAPVGQKLKLKHNVQGRVSPVSRAILISFERHWEVYGPFFIITLTQR